MSTVRIIGTGIAWNTLGTALGKIVIFANILLILSSITVYEYGLVELTMSIVSTIGLFMLPGLTSIVTADLGLERARHNHTKMKALFIEFFSFQLIIGFLAWALLFFGSSVIGYFTGNSLIDYYFKIVAFLFLLSPLRTASSMMPFVFVRHVDQAFFSTTEEVAKFVSLIIMLPILDRGADGVLYASVLAQVVVITVFAPRTISALRTFWGVATDGTLPFWRLLRDHRKWGVAASYVGTITQNLRLWIIKVMLGTEAVGLFSFALGIVTQLTSLFNTAPVIGSYLPSIMHNRHKLHFLIIQMTRYQSLIGICVVIFSAVILPLIVPLIFPAYTQALTLLLLMLIIVVTGLVKALHLTVFVAFKQQRSWFLIEILRIVILLIVLPISVMTLGIAGIAVEVVASNMLIMWERWRALLKLLPEMKMNLKNMVYLNDSDKKIIQFVKSNVSVFWSPSKWTRFFETL